MIICESKQVSKKSDFFKKQKTQKYFIILTMLTFYQLLTTIL